VIGPTPLLDFFKRGEVARDVRLLAAQGALAPRAHEQLAILILLLEDSDPEIQATADLTLGRIPTGPLTQFLARSDVPASVREFFGRRGIVPDPVQGEDSGDKADLPLVEAEGSADESGAPGAQEDPDGAARKGTVQQVAEMGFTERLKAALSGGREVRAILIRDTNKMIAATVLSNPRVSDQEVESFARMSNVPEEILRLIAGTRAWIKHYGVAVALVRNPKTPVAVSLKLMSRLGDRDLAMLSIDRNVPDMLRVAARRKVVDPGQR
jgi:hypothetical protein